MIKFDFVFNAFNQKYRLDYFEINYCENDQISNHIQHKQLNEKFISFDANAIEKNNEQNLNIKQIRNALRELQKSTSFNETLN